LLEEHAINYQLKQLPLSTSLDFPTFNGCNCDLAYIFSKFPQFIANDEEAKFYGTWASIIDCTLIPTIIWPIRYERVIKPIVLQKPTCLTTLKEKRDILKLRLQEISNYLKNNQWLGQKNFSICDITLSTAIASMDYLGEIPWNDQKLEHIYLWYLKVKSRPSFNKILEQRCGGIIASSNFKKLDF
jgi:glutathione S-transferase